MGYRGWKGVTDNKHMLIAVSYEPVEGYLSCKFNTGEPLIHVGVPENMYEILLRSPYAGSYYRKHIMRRFPTPFAQRVPEFRPTHAMKSKGYTVATPGAPEEKQMRLWIGG